MIVYGFWSAGDGNQEGYSIGIDDPQLINQLKDDYLPALICANLQSRRNCCKRKELRQWKIINNFLRRSHTRDTK